MPDLRPRFAGRFSSEKRVLRSFPRNPRHSDIYERRNRSKSRRLPFDIGNLESDREGSERKRQHPRSSGRSICCLSSVRDFVAETVPKRRGERVGPLSSPRSLPRCLTGRDSYPSFVRSDRVAAGKGWKLRRRKMPPDRPRKQAIGAQFSLGRPPHDPTPGVVVISWSADNSNYRLDERR